MNQILNMKYKKIKNKHKLIEMKRESKIKKPKMKTRKKISGRLDFAGLRGAFNRLTISSVSPCWLRSAK
jgi:hypothetical protein